MIFSRKLKIFDEFLCVLLTFLAFGCASSPKVENSADNAEIQQTQEIDGKSAKTEEKSASIDKTSKITLLFAGDIMAHSTNYRPGKFDRIWRDVAPLVQSADLAFANVEAPVADSLPWSSYPNFNMHSEYVEAAISAGFDVFSLANNHTNDQLLEGIRQTKKYFDARPGIFSCGLKEKPGDPLTYSIVEKNGFRILFVAITELLNRGDASTYIDYYPSTNARREKLISELRGLQEKSACDLFILSIHTDEPEYVLSITEKRSEFYKKLIEECKIDIIWANHPHVVRRFEELPPASVYSSQNGRTALVMYSNGNTISAQRQEPSFKNPENDWDNTGEGLFLKVEVSKNLGGIKIERAEPFLLTTYIAPSRQFVIKRLDDGFLDALDRAELTAWADYLRERRRIVNERM